MNRIIITFLLFFPLLISSQNLTKTDLIGFWKFKKFILTKEMPQDTTIYAGGGIYIEYGKLTDLEFEDIKFTQNIFQEGDSKTDLWKVSKNEIIYYDPVPQKELDFYKNHSIGVIEKHKNGKYYFKDSFSRKILSLNENELMIEDYYYNIIYERK